MEESLPGVCAGEVLRPMGCALTSASGRNLRVPVCFALAALVIAAFAPAVDVFLISDDFVWLDASFEIVSDPLASFELVNQMFRPVVKWTFLLDYLVFAQHAAGYMVTNLAIHLLNAVLLCVFLARLLRGPLLAAAAAAAFAVSPLHSEAVLWASSRGDTLLLTVWLIVLLLLYDGSVRHSRRYVTAALVVALLGAGVKESWVVFPLIATAFPVLVMGQSVRSSLRDLRVLWLGLALYLGVFLLIPALSGSPSATYYADFGPSAAILKASRTLLRFIGLDSLGQDPWMAVGLAGAVTLGALVVAVRTNNRCVQWAILWTSLTIGIASGFEFAALRHNYLPLAGFWMVVAAFADRGLVAADNHGHRKLVIVVLGVVTVTGLAIQSLALQLEIDDYRQYGEIHRRLYQDFTEIAPALQHDRALVLVDRGRRRAVEEMVREVSGVEKTFFVRAEALWQLIFLPPLMEFAGDGLHEALRPVPNDEVRSILEGSLTLLVFTDGGFRLQPDLLPELRDFFDVHGQLPRGVQVYRFTRR